ncbi:MAG: phosphate ABC transporter substrate-binding protein [Proteobacteria bacterium]|nr:MAG: phosphate ABC transporter substrate-binding protein [Pseudomonadota bacterium]
MRYYFTISPDISPDRIAAWYIFNTWMQRHLGCSIRLELFHGFQPQREAIQKDQIDLIYANPFDASTLVREKGFIALAAPMGKSDEAIIATYQDAAWLCIEDLPGVCNVALTDTPDVNMISRIMLEPADIKPEDLQINQVDTPIIVAKQLLNKKVDIGFFLAEAYDHLSDVISADLRPLIRSEIHDIRHVLLSSPRMKEHHAGLCELLAGMSHNPKGQDILQNLGFIGWDMLQQEDAEFMIDLMDTLVS